jgi:hypothetical protein
MWHRPEKGRKKQQKENKKKRKKNVRATLKGSQEIVEKRIMSCIALFVLHYVIGIIDVERKVHFQWDNEAMGDVGYYLPGDLLCIVRDYLIRGGPLVLGSSIKAIWSTVKLPN